MNEPIMRVRLLLADGGEADICREYAHIRNRDGSKVVLKCSEVETIHRAILECQRVEEVEKES